MKKELQKQMDSMMNMTMEAITKAGEKCFVVGEVVEGEKGVELV